MLPSPQQIDLTTDAGSSFPNMHRFSHKAMATIYEVIIIDEDRNYAHQAAHEAFEELDRLELELSRFIANSDVSRLNKLQAGQPLRLGVDAFECLKHAAQIFEETDGAFDVTIGPLMNCWLNKDKTLRSPSEQELTLARQNLGMHLLDLNKNDFSVTLQASPVHVDLGGIGKGYAVDALAGLLREWDIEIALIHGGFSSVFALGAPPNTEGWPLTLSHPEDRQKTLAHLTLNNQAVSGSGLQKGQHIIDPRAGRPITGKRAAWVLAPKAITTDALSTAFMIMPPDEVERFCGNHPGVRALMISDNDREGVLRHGEWQEMLPV